MQYAKNSFRALVLFFMSVSFSIEQNASIENTHIRSEVKKKKPPLSAGAWRVGGVNQSLPCSSSSRYVAEQSRQNFIPGMRSFGASVHVGQ
jgi:hypothetical protein